MKSSNKNHCAVLLCTGLLVALALIGSSSAAPIVSKPTDKDVVIDVSPFFKMNLHRDPNSSTTVLDIDVLSGLVKVGYDRLQGGKPNVDVSVFGFGSNGRTRPTYTPQARPDADGDSEVIKYV